MQQEERLTGHREVAVIRSAGECVLWRERQGRKFGLKPYLLNSA